MIWLQGGEHNGEQWAQLQQWAEDGGLLFLTVEKLFESAVTRDKIKRLHARGLIRRVVVDESHTIAECTQTFRPEYMELSALRAPHRAYAWAPLLPARGAAQQGMATDRVKLVALSAVGRKETLKVVVQNLKLRAPLFFTHPRMRKNLEFRSAHTALPRLDS